MDGREDDSGRGQARPLACADCLEGLQEYLDGTLNKQRSLRFFLHLRDCASCQQQYVLLQGLFEMLDSLPDQEVPADFDEAILAAVPYAAYREMEPLRRERVPVYLTEHFLPRFVRSRVTRLLGLGVTAVAVVSYAVLGGPQWLPALAGIGVMPELLVRLQDLARRIVAPERAEG